VIGLNEESNVLMRTLCGLLLVLLFAGCQTLSERKQSDALQEALRNYEGVIRWGSVDQARRFQRPGAVDEASAQASAATRVTHYEVVQGPAMIDANKAFQTAVIQYVFVDSQVVREVVDQQTWEYDPENERWYLTSPLPRLK
jgi:hypothetical protein